MTSAFIFLAAASAIQMSPDAPVRYDEDWVIQDTFIDQATPEANFGGDQFLSVGDGKVTLIRFNNVHARVPEGRITRAEIVFRISGGEVTGIRRAGLLRTNWNQGSGSRTQGLPFAATPLVELPGATFLARFDGEDGLRWSNPGATGADEVLEIESARLVRDGAFIRVTNLEQAVTMMRDNPAENYGFRLDLEGSAELHSSRSGDFRPQLIVETDASFGASAAFPGPILYGLQADEFPAQGEAFPAAGAPVRWQVRVGNWGESAVSDLAVEFRRDGRLLETVPVTQTVEPGDEQVISATLPWDARDEERRWSQLSARLVGEGVPRDQNTVVSAYIGGIPIDFRSDADGAEAWRQADRFVHWVNEVVFPSVRFRVASFGVQERIRIASVNQVDGVYLQGNPGTEVANLNSLLEALGALDGSQRVPFLEGELPQQVSGVTLTTRPGGIATHTDVRGDFRNDSNWDNFLALPDPTFPEPILARTPLPNRNVMSRTSATLLHHAQGQLGAARQEVRRSIPRQLALQITNARKEPIAGAPVRAFWHDGEQLRPLTTSSDRTTSPGGSMAVVYQETPDGGSSPFGQFPRPDDAWSVVIEVRAPSGIETLWIPYWQLLDEYGRGNRDLAIIALRGSFSDAPADRSDDRAIDRILTDSKGSFPAELQGLVDGRYDNPLVLDEEGQYWIEIDLGRDRPLAEVRLLFAEGAAFSRFQILVYNTAQTVGQARVWTEEMSGSITQQTRANRASDGVMMHSYRAPTTSARFLRISVPPGAARGTLHGIQVFPSRMADPVD